MAGTSGGGEPRRVIWLVDGMRLGGAERMAALLAEKGAPPGWEFRLWALQSVSSAAARGFHGGGESLNARSRTDAAAFARLLRQLRAENAKIVHAHLRTAILWGTAAGRLLRLPAVATLHVLPAGDASGREAWLRQAEIWSLNRLARRVITLSQSQQAAWEAAGVLRQGCVRLPHGLVLPAATAEARARLRRQLGMEAGEQLWLTVAVVREKKGWREWLEGTSTALDLQPGLHFAWLGDGEGYEPLARRAARLCQNRRFHLPGAQDRIADWLAAADGFLFPSREEAQPTALLEAMAAGLPIAASGIAANREVLGDAGLYFPCQDAPALRESLLCLARDAGLRQRQGEAARRRFRANFEFEPWRRQLFELYDAILAEERRTTTGWRRLHGAPPPPTPAAPRILIPEFFSTGGLYHYSLQLSQALARQGAEVQLLTGRDPELRPADTTPGFTLRPRLLTWDPCRPAARSRWGRMARRWGHGIGYGAAWMQIAWSARQWRPDWILLGDLEHRCDAWFLRRLARKHQLADIWHNVQAIERQRVGQLLKEQPWRDGMSRHLRAIFVHSEWARQQLQARLAHTGEEPLGTPDRPRIIAIPHGLSELMHDFQGPDPRLARRLQLPEGLPLGLCFGALTRYKGIETLLAAMARLRAEERPALLIAGRALPDAPLEEWKNSARRSGLDPWVRWDVRYIPAEEAGWYFQAADFVCLPYRAVTQSGVAHLALQWGKPMLASTAGGLREIVQDDETGWLFEPGDADGLALALRQARLQPERLARYREAALRRAGRHPGWDAIAAQILAELVPKNQATREKACAASPVSQQ